MPEGLVDQYLFWFDPATFFEDKTSVFRDFNDQCDATGAELIIIPVTKSQCLFTYRATNRNTGSVFINLYHICFCSNLLYKLILTNVLLIPYNA